MAIETAFEATTDIATAIINATDDANEGAILIGVVIAEIVDAMRASGHSKEEIMKFFLLLSTIQRQTLTVFLQTLEQE